MGPPGHRYRPEIDGLRALAVLAVVFFHYRVPFFGGGFVGVDVFFVISGYLITSLVAADMDGAGFSFLHFYERRVRRIFPALFAMLLLVTAGAFLLLFPVDLVNYAHSLLATALFGANVEFWREAGYFDAAANQKPLLHLWSIGVEEQFYLVFPAILVLAGGRSRARRLAIVAALFVGSFALAVWGVWADPVATFYLLPARAWELMLGALLALGVVPMVRSRWVGEALAMCGLVLIVISAVTFRTDWPFPGPLALAPCVGTALVILGADPGRNWAGRALSWRPVVFVGLVSYSLYLWHWPLFVFATYVELHEPGAIASVGLMAVSFVLAVLSWRFVEQPLRRARPALRLAPFAAAAVTVALTAGSAGIAAASDGLPERLRPDLRTILAEQDDHEPRIAQCFALTSGDVRRGRLCRIGATTNTPPSFLLWGDSHADAILPAVARAASRAGRVGLFAGGASCPPLMNVTTPQPDCRAFNDAVMALAEKSQFSEIILEARWAKYAEGSTFGTEPKGRVVLRDALASAGGGADNHDVFFRGLSRTVAQLRRAAKAVVLVAAVPEVGWPVPAVLARRALAHETQPVAPPLGVYLVRQAFVLKSLAAMQSRFGATILYPHKVLCASGYCAVSENGTPLYRDEHHLSVFGAHKLDGLLGAAFPPASASRDGERESNPS
ncbi:MAG TPA: acyltransferase family protein [Rhizomicrobium sp.]|jgi:peptidoglycan/LPS O-acetylase OafA/YrhL